MKKKILMLSMLSGGCIYPMDVKEQEFAEGIGQKTLLILDDNEEILRSAGVSLESAQDMITQNLQKREEKLQEVENLEMKQELHKKLENQILESLKVLDSELVRTVINEQATEAEVAKLNSLLQQLQKTQDDEFLATPIKETAADKKDEHKRQKAYIADLQERIEGIRKGMAGQQEQSVEVQRKLKSVRTVVVLLEKYTLEIAEANEGAAGSATVDILREAAEERQLDASKQEDLSEEQPKSSGFWNRCIVS